MTVVAQDKGMLLAPLLLNQFLMHLLLDDHIVLKHLNIAPFPDEFGDVADEDTWFKMNKGFIADLDSIRMTPAKEVVSFPSTDEIPDCSVDNYKEEVQNLQRQLKLAIDEKNELEKRHEEQLVLNNQLMEEVSKLRKEVLLFQEIPQKLRESLVNCKAIYKDIFSTFQSCVADEKSPTAKLLSSTSEITTYLMSTLEAHISMAIDGYRSVTYKDSPVQENSNVLPEKLSSAITSLSLTEAQNPKGDSLGSLQNCSKYKDCTWGWKIASWKAELSAGIKLIKERFESLEQELDINNHLLEASKERIHGLERESRLLTEERDELLLTVSSSSTRIASLNDQNKRVLQDLTREIQKRKDLQEQIKQFSIAFASRQRSLVTFHNEFKSKLEHLKAQSPVLLPKSFGC